MSSSPFQRPGTPAASEEKSWPYARPEPEASVDPVVSQAPSGSRRGGIRTRWVVVSGIAGIFLGGVGAALLSTLYFADDAPLPITLDTFPEYLVGLERADVGIREAADTERIQQFEAEFEDQKDRFLFAHGNEGAAVGYGQRFVLTIANGGQSLPLPTNLDTWGARPPTLISLDTDLVSCVFEPRVGLYDGAVLQAPADLTAAGQTDCVLNDFERHFSLRITSAVPGGANETATEFAGILERTRTSLTR